MAYKGLAALLGLACCLASPTGLRASQAAEERDTEGRTALLRACEKGDEAEVKRLLDDGADVNTRGKWGRAPLLAAVMSCRWRYNDMIMGGVQGRYARVCKALLEHGAKVDAADDTGRTALMQAAGWEHSEIVKVLLEHAPDLDIADRAGRTALTWAAGHGYAQDPIVQTLLKYGARVGLLDALLLGRTLQARGLIADGASVSVRGPIGETPLHVAAQKADLDTVLMLLDRHADPNARDEKGVTPLFVAVAGRAVWSQVGPVSYSRDHLSDRVAIVRALLAAHGSPNARLAKDDVPWAEGTAGATPLMRAALVGDLRIARALLAGKADPNAADAEGSTPLMYTAPRERPPRGQTGDWAGVARTLLAAGARINSRNQLRQTALIVAAENSSPEVARLLIDKGADLNARDKYGQTAMTAAVNSPEIVRMLLAHGAKLLPDDRGWTALTGALVYDNRALASDILARRPPIGLVDAAVMNDLARVRRLLAGGSGRAHATSALGVCIERCRPEIAEALLAAGANPNATVGFGMRSLLADAIELPGDTPRRGSQQKDPRRDEQRVVRIARAMLQHGAAADKASEVYNFEGDEDTVRRITPLMFAAARGSVPIIRLLLQHGANANAENSAGRRALDYAVRKKHEAAAAALRAAGGTPGPGPKTERGPGFGG